MLYLVINELTANTQVTILILEKNMTTNTTIDFEDKNQFDAIAEQWWDPSGSLKSLHPFTPIRIEYIKNSIKRHHFGEWEKLKPLSNLQILDIGIGSGCILMSILKEKKNFIGTGIDISKKSLQISEVNGQKLRINNRLRLFKSNIDNFNTGKYDLIISNPPYIKKNNLKCLEKDIGFEPKQALDGGLDGLSEIRKVINKSSELIKRSGHFIIEIGFDQKNKVKKILRDKGFYIKKTVKDLSNHDRCIVSIKT